MRSGPARRALRVALLVATAGLSLQLGIRDLSAQLTAPSPIFDWQVVVNNGVAVPGDGRYFNSYNPPSVNVDGLVVFRARSKGGASGQPAHGVYMRDMAVKTEVARLFDRQVPVPAPNNLGVTITEPPSFPRIDMWSATAASRGNHRPVWSYLLTDGTESRAGTSGIYTTTFGELMTGASTLGAVPGFEFFAVPDSGGLRFDVFPGAPAVGDNNTIVFKGNYTRSAVAHTGVYYRELADAPAGGAAPAVVIANTERLIPGSRIPFGSTAPPSAAGRRAVFAGFDNEEHPTKGGIYLAPLNGRSNPRLTELVRIGGQVPGERKGATFNRLGEGVSFDGRFVAFWGAWGRDVRSRTMYCSEEGNADRIAYCRQQYPGGFTTTVPVHQGIFVHDTRNGRTSVVARTPGDFDDFLYWNFSGMVPGTSSSDDDGESARWRSATFVAVSGLVDGRLTDATHHVAFKARRVRSGNAVAGDPVDGIYLATGPHARAFAVVCQTGMDGTWLDAAAVDPLSHAPLPVTDVGIERDGFRGRWLTINASMATEEAGWAGVYLAGVSER